VDTEQEGDIYQKQLIAHLKKLSGGKFTDLKVTRLL
jgi:hypothetical protein